MSGHVYVSCHKLNSDSEKRNKFKITMTYYTLRQVSIIIQDPHEHSEKLRVFKELKNYDR